MLAGDAEQIVDRIGPLADLGVQEVLFQHYDFASDEVPEYMASELAPRLSGL